MTRFVSEMGGKDAIVVDETADLDAAASGVVRSAFGFQGQKCSACSRLIVDSAVKDRLLELILEKTKPLPAGHPWDGPCVFTGPVANARAHAGILEAIETRQGGGAPGAGRARPRPPGLLHRPDRSSTAWRRARSSARRRSSGRCWP